MRIEISREDCVMPHIDRDGCVGDHGRQGFDVGLAPPIWIHFEDEADAERIARFILDRLGVKVT